MTTMSAGAAAGLLVALMVLSTSDRHGRDLLSTTGQATGSAHPGALKGFDPQPDPPKVFGAGAVKPAGR